MALNNEDPAALGALSPFPSEWDAYIEDPYAVPPPQAFGVGFPLAGVPEIPKPINARDTFPKTPAPIRTLTPEEQEYHRRVIEPQGEFDGQGTDVPWKLPPEERPIMPWDKQPGPAPVPRTDAARIGQGEVAGGEVGQASVASVTGGQLPPSVMEQVQSGAPWQNRPDFLAGTVDADGLLTPPFLDVDAISGGLMPGQETHRGPHETLGDPEMPEDYMSGTELGEHNYLTKSLGQQVAIEVEHEAARREFIAAREIDASREAKQRAQRNHDAYVQAQASAQKASEELAVEARRIAETPIDNDRWAESRSTFQTIAAIAAAFIGGFAANKTGRNLGLESIERAIEQDIETQKANLANKRAGIGQRQSMLAEQVERIGDVYQAGETLRAGMWEAAKNEVAAEASKYNQRGTTMVAYMKLMRDMDAAQHEAMLKAQAENRKRLEEANKRRMEQEEADERKRHNKAQEGIGWKNAQNDTIRALAEKKKADAEAGSSALLSTDELRAMGINVPKNAKLPPISVAMAKKIAETAKSMEDWEKAARENSPDEHNRQLGIGEIVDDQGKPVKFRDVTFAGNLANTKADVDTSVGLIDELVRIRNEEGWSSSTFKGTGWQKAQGALSSLLLKSKNTDQLGVLAGSDVDIEMKKLTGGVDPTGVRDPIPALLAARERMLTDLNAKVRAQAVLPAGRSLKPYAPPNMYSVDASTSLIQGKTSIEHGEGAKRGKAGEVIQNTFYGVDNDEASRLAENAAKSGPTGLDLADDARVLEAIATARGDTVGAADAVQRLVDASSGSRESVSTGVLNRIRHEAPDVYERVVAKLPAKLREQQKQIAAPPATKIKLGTPAYQFQSLDVGELATSVATDDELQSVVIEKAMRGTPAEKKKALEIIQRSQGGGQ